MCRLGGLAAFLLLVYSLATMVQLLVVGGQPATAAEAFSLLQSNRILGLLRLDLPTVLAMPLYYFVFLGLFAALRRTDCADAVLCTALAFVGATLLLAAPTALSLVPLSERYAAAPAEAMGVQILAAGEALLAADIWHGTGRPHWRRPSPVQRGDDLRGTVLMAVAGPLYLIWFPPIDRRLPQLGRGADCDKVSIGGAAV